jgi:molecular chaperone DnaK
LGDKLSDDEKNSATAAIADVKTAMAGDDKEDIERKTTALEQSSSAILQKMYEQSAAAGAAQGAGSESGSSQGHTGTPKDDVLDAEFEEVKDGDRKKA